MKTRSIFLTVLCLSSLLSFAQKMKVPVPETLSEINYYDKKANTIQKLEKGNAAFVTKPKAFGFAGAATNYELAGEKATIRFTGNDSTASFVVSLAESMGDPSGWFSLFKATIKKGRRIGNYLNSKAIVGKSGAGTGIVPYTVKKLGAQLYEIIPSVPLEKGEYFFVNKGTGTNYGGLSAEAFAFAVD